MPVQGCTLPYLSACTSVHFTLSQCLTRVDFTLPQCLYNGDLYHTLVPVQGCTLPYLSACTSAHFTLPHCLYKGALYLISVPVQVCTLPYLSACTRVHFTLPQCLYKGDLYLHFTLKNQNFIQEEIKSRLKLGNACYHLVQNVLSSCLLSINLKIKIFRTIIVPVIFV